MEGISAATKLLNVGAAALPVVGPENTKFAFCVSVLLTNAPEPPIVIIEYALQTREPASNLRAYRNYGPPRHLAPQRVPRVSGDENLATPLALPKFSSPGALGIPGTFLQPPAPKVHYQFFLIIDDTSSVSRCKGNLGQLHQALLCRSIQSVSWHTEQAAE